MMLMRRCVQGSIAVLIAVAFLVLLSCALTAGDKARPSCKLQIEVTAGDDNRPVESASIYVRFTPPGEKKLAEMNLKTNHEGITHSPEIPSGKVMVQVIASGWKTFGRWYDVDPGPQTIKIHLEKPPKWY